MIKNYYKSIVHRYHLSQNYYQFFEYRDYNYDKRIMKIKLLEILNCFIAKMPLTYQSIAVALFTKYKN
jgi:hypothetical protein